MRVKKLYEEQKMKKIIILLLVGIFFPIVLQANVVWPALYTETKVSSFPIIGLSLLLEYLFFKWLFKLGFKHAVYYTLAANTVSGVLGLFLRPLSGIAYELSLGMLVNSLFHWGTFNPVAWFFVPIIGGALNGILELLTIRLIWKQKITKRNYLLTWGINTLTVAIATIWVILYPPQM
jgi:hypothetical protein